MTNAEEKKVYVHIRLDPKLKEQAEKAAKDEDRSFGSWVTRVIKEALKK